MMSCFGRRKKGAELPDEDEEYRERRNRIQSEHRIAFLPSLLELIGFVRNRERHCDIDEIKKGDLKRLERVRYFKFVRSLYPEVDLNVDSRNGKVELSGRGKPFEDACDKCFSQLRDMKLVEENLELSSEENWKWEIVANERCGQYLGEKMTSNDIMAEIKAADSGDKIIVTALNKVECQKARKVLDESIIQDVLPIPNDVDKSFDFEGSQFHHFKTEREKQKPLKILFRQSEDETPVIQFFGVNDNVVEAKKATEDFIEVRREKDHKLTLELSKDKLIFLRGRFSHLVKRIEDNLKVDIKLEAGRKKCTFHWKGQPNTVDNCVASLEELCKSIWEEDKTIELPGLEHLLDKDTDGEKLLELIQKAYSVFIHRVSEFKRDRLVYESTTKISLIGEEKILEKAVVEKKHSLGNLFISLKDGQIENERADVLAYSALPNLNDCDTTSGEALKHVGGTTYTEVCKPHTNISHGDVVCTTGGNLACQYVLHAVGCDVKGKERNKKVVRMLINKCLQKCIDLQVASLAMSSFTADENEAKEFFEMVREEMERLNASSPVQYPLRVIQIVYPKKKAWVKQRTSPPIRPILQSSLPQHTETKYGYSSKFTSGNVILREGELSTFKADAIINILPNHLHFPSKNSVCDTILLAAGSGVQDELERHRRNSHPGSIFPTSAGSIGNVKQILHIIPTSTDGPGLQSSLEQCLDFVKSLSLSNVIFPIAATMSVEVSLRHLIELILVATQNCSNRDSVPLEIVILVERVAEFDNLKSLFKDVVVAPDDVAVHHVSSLQSSDDKSTNVSHVDNDDVDFNQETPNAYASIEHQNRTAGISKSAEAQISIPATKRAEDKMLLRFVGFSKAVYDSISEVSNFVDRNKATESIEISTDGLQFRQEYLKDLDRLSSIYHVLINLRRREITVEGIKHNVHECRKEVIRLLNKYERNNNATPTDILKDCVVSEPVTSWLWESESEVHREKFEKFLEYAQEHRDEIKVIGGVRLCSSNAFCIGHGSDGTDVYIGLGKDGCEKAVKRLVKNQCEIQAMHEKEMLKKPTVTASKHTAKYWNFDDESDKDFVYLILDLYEESLGEYVERNDLENLMRNAPEIIRQILEGLCDIHQGPILHRDLNPWNIMRDLQNTWLLLDFGISRTLQKDKEIHESKPRGNVHWRATESHRSKEAANDSNVQYSNKSDIQVAGMLLYFIYTKGQHPFGPEEEIISNISKKNPPRLNLKNRVLEDLLAWMLSHNPEERPSAKEALKHPYLQTADEKFELVCTVGNHSKIKARDSTCDIVRQINSDTTIGKWKASIDADVFNYLCIDPKKPTPNTYGKQLADCLRFIRNANQHWNDPKPVPRPKSIECKPQDFFLGIYPSLPMVVHKILRSSDWKEKEEFTKFFN